MLDNGPFRAPRTRKILVSVKVFARYSGTGNAAPILRARGKLLSLIKLLVLGGVSLVFVVFGGGEECRFYFYGREELSERHATFPG